MSKHLYPTGPYYLREFLNIHYRGQKLIMGIYKIFIEATPMNDEFPIFFTTVDGTSQPSIIRNSYLWTTSAEIEYAWSEGYT
jgi:hypothetical protein